MTTKLPISARDAAALDAAYTRGDAILPDPAWSSDLEPRDGAFLSLARHLARVTAGVADLTSTDSNPKPPMGIAFRTVLTRWPDAWDPALYPLAAISEKTTKPWDAITVAPVTFENVQGVNEDVVTDDWALWHVGEDVGEAMVSIFAQYDSHAKALEAAVVAALFADFADSTPRTALVLPLPERALPPPFWGTLDVTTFPRVRYSFAKGGSIERDERQANAWRIDVAFKWQSPRFAARARVPDLIAVAHAVVGPPGQEI